MHCWLFQMLLKWKIGFTQEKVSVWLYIVTSICGFELFDVIWQLIDEEGGGGVALKILDITTLVIMHSPLLFDFNVCCNSRL